MISRSAPASAASAATSSMPGVSTTGSNSLGTVLVAGRNRVPRPGGGDDRGVRNRYLRPCHRSHINASQL